MGERMFFLVVQWQIINIVVNFKGVIQTSIHGIKLKWEKDALPPKYLLIK